MEKTLDKQVKETITEQSSKFDETQETKDFEKAIEEFERMVESGLVKKRGYTLMTIDDAHLHRATFNTKNNPDIITECK